MGKKEKGPLSWADRLKNNNATPIPPQARPKKAPQQPKPTGIPQSPTKAPWAKASSLANPTKEVAPVSLLPVSSEPKKLEVDEETEKREKENDDENVEIEMPEAG